MDSPATGPAIYMDYGSTTPPDRRVIEAMIPHLQGTFGNPANRSQPHGGVAHKLLQASRKKVADAVGASPDEIVFTSGSTQSNNLVVRSVMENLRRRGRHLVTSQIEHPSVLATCRFMESQGFAVTYVAPRPDGIVRAEDIAAALRADTVLVSLMLVNNEIGTIQPVREVARIAREQGVLVHTDATAAFGRLPIHVGELGVDFMSFNAHKAYGPKGIGALYVHVGRSEVLRHGSFGGDQEIGIVSGTVNLPAVVGFAEAAALAAAEAADPEVKAALLAKRERLIGTIRAHVPDVHVNGSMEPGARVAGNVNVAFRNIEAGALIEEISRTISLTATSACEANKNKPSHVLQALGLGAELTGNVLRMTFGRFTTDADIDKTAATIAAAASKLTVPDHDDSDPFTRKVDTVEQFWAMTDDIKLATRYAHSAQIKALATLPPDHLLHVLVQFRYFTEYYAPDVGYLISRLAHGRLQAALARILAEELGDGDVGRSHVALYDDFLVSLGVPRDEIPRLIHPAIESGLGEIRDISRREATGFLVGFRGMGGECLCQIYLTEMLKSLSNNPFIRQQTRTVSWLFWEIHTGEVDIAHRETMRQMVTEYMRERPDEVADVCAGVREITRLWDRFWGAIHESSPRRDPADRPLGRPRASP